MSRIRTIKPEMPGHPTLARVSVPARLLMVWLITDADHEGGFGAAPKRLAGVLYPYDEDVSAADVDGWLNELAVVGLIRVDGYRGLLLYGAQSEEAVRWYRLRIDARKIRRQMATPESCPYCGAADRPYHLDHIVAISRGGTNDPTNLQFICDRCNLVKGAN